MDNPKYLNGLASFCLKKFLVNRPEHRNPDISVRDLPYPDWAFPGRGLGPIFVLTTSGNLPRTSRLKCGTRSRRRQRGRGEKSRKSSRKQKLYLKNWFPENLFIFKLWDSTNQCSCLKRGTVYSYSVYNDHPRPWNPQPKSVLLVRDGLYSEGAPKIPISIYFGCVGIRPNNINQDELTKSSNLTIW